MPTASTFGGGSAEDPIKLSDGDEKQWPRDFYVCNIVPCFHDAKTSVRGSHTQHTAAIVFHKHFLTSNFVLLPSLTTKLSGKKHQGPSRATILSLEKERLGFG
jgi:hypothetical protein